MSTIYCAWLWLEDSLAKVQIHRVAGSPPKRHTHTRTHTHTHSHTHTNTHTQTRKHKADFNLKATWHIFSVKTWSCVISLPEWNPDRYSSQLSGAEAAFYTLTIPWDFDDWVTCSLCISQNSSSYFLFLFFHSSTFYFKLTK